MAKAKLIAGNWKMNGLATEADHLLHSLRNGATAFRDRAELAVCTPATLVFLARQILQGSAISWGGQDCHREQKGAFTGNISAAMLADLGCKYVIVGHSERRQHHGETSHDVAAKAAAAHAAGIIPIICVGETEKERMLEQHYNVVQAQIKDSLPSGTTAENTVIAYEPVWAIGTGKTATLEDIAGMHMHVRGSVGEGMRILYGGSVKADNAEDIMRLVHVDGVLVGGASLKADEFLAIAAAA